MASDVALETDAIDTVLSREGGSGGERGGDDAECEVGPNANPHDNGEDFMSERRMVRGGLEVTQGCVIMHIYTLYSDDQSMHVWATRAWFIR